MIRQFLHASSAEECYTGLIKQYRMKLNKEVKAQEDPGPLLIEGEMRDKRSQSIQRKAIYMPHMPEVI